MKRKFSVDRVESDAGIVICFDDEQNKYEFPMAELPLSTGQMFSAELDDEGHLHHVEPLPEETAAKRKEMSNRTSALFRRKKS